jgi:hypothetical protein
VELGRVGCISSISILGKVEFRHFPRESNEVAYNLARFCYDSKNSCNWVDEPPSCILSKLLADVIILRFGSDKFQTHSFPYQGT